MRLRHVRHVAGHAIAGPDAASRSAAGERDDGAMQLGPTSASGGAAASSLKMIAGVPSPATEQILGEIQPRVGKESRARHLLEIVDDAVAAFAADAAEVPHGAPEVRRAIDRELVERGVVGNRYP